MLKFTASDVLVLAAWAVWYCWWCTLPVAGVIALVGWLTRGRLRVGLWVFAGLLAGYVAAGWCVSGVSTMQDGASQARADAHHASLFQVQREPRVIGGFLLPPGATVPWEDDDKTIFSKILLPGPTTELGVRMAGTLEMKAKDEHPRWTGTLNEGTELGGWTCAAGPVVMTEEGKLVRCTLGAERRLRAFTVPAGSAFYDRFPESDESEQLEVPAGKTVSIPALGTVVPAGFQLDLGRDGTIAKIESDIDTLGGKDETWPDFRVRGISVHFFAELYYEDGFAPDPRATQTLRWIRLNLYGRPTCAGQLLPDDQVQLSPDGRTLVDENSSGDSVGPRYQVLQCTFAPKP